MTKKREELKARIKYAVDAATRDPEWTWEEVIEAAAEAAMTAR